MRSAFGPIVQQGYVVPDLGAAVDHWLARGVGPFFVEEHIAPPGEFDGKPMRTDLSAAFAYWGDQQIEVIEQHDDTPTIYREYLDHYPDGGLQHVAVWVDDIDETLASAAAIGAGFDLRQRFGSMHAYIDSKTRPGIMIQLMARHPLMLELFEGIAQANQAWDGRTDPIRKIDWTTGRPKLPT